MHQMHISTNKVSSVILGAPEVGIQKRIVKTKRVWGEKKTKRSAMRLSQIRGRIELCMREIILCFEMTL
jgi:hypothetical protein